MYVTLNPQYGIRNEKYASYICLLDNSIDAILQRFPRYLQIPPLCGYIISQFNGDKLELSINRISYTLQIDRTVVSKFVTQLINKSTSLEIKYQGITIRFPLRILIGSKMPFSKKNIKIVSNKDFNPFNKFTSSRPSMPLSINIMLTTKCGTDCIYCYADRNTKVDFKLTKILSLLDECHKYGVLRVGLSGGDIFAYKDWKKVIAKMYEYNYSPFISTKIPLDDDSITFLTESGIKEIQFSLDSILVEESRLIVKTKTGYIEKVEKMFNSCKTNNIKVEVQTVLTKYNANLNSLKSLYETLLVNDIDTWSIVPSFYSNFKGEYEGYRANDKMLNDCYQYLTGLQNKTSLRILIRGLENKMKAAIKYKDTDKFIQHNKGCAITTYSMWINVFGQVVLCEMLYNNQVFHLGNVNNTCIADIWQSEKMKSFYNYKISNLPVNKESRCYTCKDFNQCKIGNIKKVCIADIITVYGPDKWDYPDPKCPYSPECNMDLILA